MNKNNELSESESDGSFDKISLPKRKKLKKSSNFKSSNKKKSQSNKKKISELVEEELDYSGDEIPSPKKKKSNEKNNKSKPHHQEEDEEGGTSDNTMSLLNFNYHDEVDYDYDDIIESEKITKKKPQNEKRKRSTKIIEEPIPDEQLNDEYYDPNYTSTYLQLMDIFPDADEDSMKEKVKSIYRNQRLITAFVTKNLEEPVYKKKFIEKSQQLKTRTKPKKLTPDILYTTAFNVKNFLKLYPRPHKHFENPNRKCEPSCLALEFLKSKFKKLSRNTIEKIYVDSNHNMSIAANVLSKTPVEFNIDIKRHEFIYPDEDIEFLQESAFINYREDIKNEYKKRKQKVNKIINTHLECQCCFAQEHISNCATCEGGHVFCHSCIISGTNTYLGDGESNVYCFTGCGEQISTALLEDILDEKQFKRLMKNKESVELLDVHVEGTTPCPFCKIGSKQSQDDKIFKCQNSDCMIESCVDCKMINHQPDPCNLTEIAKRLIENSMSQAITRECHNCQKIYIKDYGCNKITCTCGVSLCYLCNKSIRGDSHFRKEGEKVKPNETPKCPYYCDDDYLNAQTVRKVGEEVKKKLLAINPKLDIDIDHLLPSIPAPTVDGPHQLIPDNTDIADVYVQQIVQKENFFSKKINDNKST
ncbi:uncharacterized protein LOC122850696 [Aphidius gifuensis]|nr:uncharacterized protein LOC122850696 [Aphidius gifuensis]